MRYFLLLLHIALVGAMLTSIFAMGTAVNTNAGEVGAFTLSYALIYLLRVFITGVTVTAEMASFASFLQVIFVIYMISALSALLAGYRPFRWTKWIGFIICLGLGALSLAALSDGMAAGIFCLAAFFLLCAFLFLRMKRGADAERIRKPAAVCSIALWIIGVVIYLSVSPTVGISRILLAIFSVVPFILHYLTIKSFQFEVKSTVKTALTLGATLVCSITMIFLIPVMFGPALVSWFAVVLFIESKLLSFKAQAAATESLSA